MAMTKIKIEFNLYYNSYAKRVLFSYLLGGRLLA